MTLVTACVIDATRSSSRCGREPMNVVYSSARGSSDRTMNRSRWLRCGSSPCARVQTTTSRATSADRGVWISRRPGRVDSARRHLPDEGTLVADQRRDEVQLAREAQGARDHPPGDQAHQDAAVAGGPDRAPRVRSDDQVVADERPVDVEGDQLDGQDGVGRHDGGHVTMMPDGRSRRWRTGAQGRADLSPRLGSREPHAAGRPGRSRPCRPSPAAVRQRDRRSPPPGPHRSRAARCHCRPGRPAVDRAAGR